ncbi:MAG: acetyl-CoA hydrolase/transferase family protein [Solirubrobacteraceae bacterium]
MADAELSTDAADHADVLARIRDQRLLRKLATAEEAAALIDPGSTVGMSGFTGSGYPKAVPRVLADRMQAARARGEQFKVSVWTGASTAPELDGLLAAADGVDMRMPFQSDPVSRARINAGAIDYIDVHLSHVSQMVREGFFGRLDWAVIEIVGITEHGELIPSSSVGNNKTWLEMADRVILEVNLWQPPGLEGMHDIYYGATLPPNRKPLNIITPGDRIGVPYLQCDPEKIVAIVPTDASDRNLPFKDPDADSELIAGYLLEFLSHEVKYGRLPKQLLPLQSGVGNVTNAVLAGLRNGPFRPLTAYTEVIQDAMLELLRDGTVEVASATAFSLSEDATQKLYADLPFYRGRIILRQESISNHPEVIRRLGCIASNGMVEADIYGNVNSTHVMGSSILNGIGGSGDFTRNSYLSMFVSPSVAKNGTISCIVPMASHVDHTEHDVHVLITEQGVADLRGLSPRRRAQLIIERCAHPSYRPALWDYYARALVGAPGKHTPHLLREALLWHTRYLETGTMRADAGQLDSGRRLGDSRA